MDFKTLMELMCEKNKRMKLKPGLRQMVRPLTQLIKRKEPMTPFETWNFRGKKQSNESKKWHKAVRNSVHSREKV
jgi:hypothetical protein